MGLLDRLVDGIKAELKEDLKSGILDALNLKPTAPEESSPTPTPVQTENASNSNIDYSNTYNTGDDYFAALITAENFLGYAIERNVHPKFFDASAHPSCYPISYLFKKDDAPVLAVLVMNSNQYRAMTARGTYQVLDDNGIKYIRFFKGMKNEESYVLGRIRENL